MLSGQLVCVFEGEGVEVELILKLCDSSVALLVRCAVERGAVPSRGRG